ncbi:MAG: 50S ribosomal protein L30 [Halobacteriovoraceae bacterium]|nr:50S ribosomal protein L30 [Halobacteriovoraceae bacterium]
MAAKTITIKLKRSTIGCTKDQISTIKGLGLKKIGHEKTLENTPCVRGMIKKMIQWIDILAEN